MITSIKHNHPFVFSILKLSLIASLLTVCVWAVSQVHTINKPVSSFFSAVYWQVRAEMFDGPDKASITPATHFVAEIKGMDEHGHVVFTHMLDGTSQTVKAELADLQLLDIEGVTKIVNLHRGRSLFVDYYEYELNGETIGCVVLWDEFDEPINAELINRNFARPVSTPPTNVLNLLMAHYFWNVFFSSFK